MIVAPPKTGKTTILKNIASAMMKNYPKIKDYCVIDRWKTEEVTDIRECLNEDNVEVVASTSDEAPENHKRVAELVIERCKRIVESGKMLLYC